MCAQVSIYCGYFLTDNDKILHMQQDKDPQQIVWNSYSRLTLIFWNTLNSVEYFWNEVRSLLLFAPKRLIMIIFKNVPLKTFSSRDVGGIVYTIMYFNFLSFSRITVAERTPGIKTIINHAVIFLILKKIILNNSSACLSSASMHV